MIPVVNTDIKMPKKLFEVLSWLETFCVVSGINSVTHADVMLFINQRAGKKVASLFKPKHLLSSQDS